MQTLGSVSEQAFVDHYEILQVSQTADTETIERVFRLLAKRYHPDNAVTGDPQQFDEVRKAYDLLSNPERRQSTTSPTTTRRATSGESSTKGRRRTVVSRIGGCFMAFFHCSTSRDGEIQRMAGLEWFISNEPSEFHGNISSFRCGICGDAAGSRRSWVARSRLRSRAWTSSGAKSCRFHTTTCSPSRRSRRPARRPISGVLPTESPAQRTAATPSIQTPRSLTLRSPGPHSLPAISTARASATD